MERLARVLFPRPDDSAEVATLYLLARGSGGETLPEISTPGGAGETAPSNTPGGAGEAAPSNTPGGGAVWTAASRTSATFAAGSRVSFATYFGAFPASYWFRWSQLREVLLRLELSGTADVTVFASTAQGTPRVVARRSVEHGGDGAAIQHIDVAIPLSTCADGGWFWFDLTANTEVTLHAAGWWAPTAPGPQVLPGGGVAPAPEAKVTVGIPTFNRPADAVAAIASLGEDPEVNAVIDALIMPDQGTRHPSDEPGYAEAIGRFGDRFRTLRQGNLGGSGGYSRIMFEALGGVDGSDHPTSAPYLLFMDDDIAIEPDAVLRAVQVARYARGPMLVGGQMLNLMQRSHLHSMGEAINPANFMWGPAPHTHYDHDFARVPLGVVTEVPANVPSAAVTAAPANVPSEQHAPASSSATPSDAATVGEASVPTPARPAPYTSRDLHRRIDVDFNGWWMCLIPRRVAEEIGQPLPLFIKWDDAEYGLRAARAGYRTATWPGVAIWHMAWGNKDNEIDWQSFFFLRNRLTVAALYGGNLTGFVKDQLKVLGKHVMCMEYSTIALHNEALRAFLAGPDPLPAALPTALATARTIQQSFSDGRIVDIAQFTTSTGQTDGSQPGGGASADGDGGPHAGSRVGGGASGNGGSPAGAHADGDVAKPSIARQALAFGATMLHQLRRPRISAQDAAVCPEKVLTAEQARWFALVGVDAAAVLNATGTGAAIRHRDRGLAGSLVKEQMKLLRDVRRREAELKEAYQKAQPHLVSRELWRTIFEDDARRRE